MTTDALFWVVFIGGMLVVGYFSIRISDEPDPPEVLDEWYNAEEDGRW